MHPDTLRHWLTTYGLAAAALLLQWCVVALCRERKPEAGKVVRIASWAMSVVVLALPITFISARRNIFTADFSTWLQSLYLFYPLFLLCAFLWLAMTRPLPTDTSRRQLLGMAVPMVAAAPALAGAAAVIVARSGARLTETDVRVRDLPRDLEGLRIVQLTDIHYGPFFGRKELERAVALANGTRAHVAVVTGDLVTRAGDDVETPMRLCAQLKADAGIFICHGNHDEYSGLLPLADRLSRRLGIQVLRQRAVVLRFGGAGLNVAGIDYVPFRRKLPPQVAALHESGMTNLLLAHNPDGFPQAASAGFDLTISGHTHGGQLNFDLGRESHNIARLYTPYVKGLYEEGGKSVYVSSGLGTVAVPMRLGAPPEVSLIRLCGA